MKKLDNGFEKMKGAVGGEKLYAIVQSFILSEEELSALKTGNNLMK